MYGFGNDWIGMITFSFWLPILRQNVQRQRNCPLHLETRSFYLLTYLLTYVLTYLLRQGYPVAPCVPSETEADPVQLNLAFYGLLVMFRYFTVIRCPCKCNSLLWQRHLNLCIYNNNHHHHIITAITMHMISNAMITVKATDHDTTELKPSQ